MRAALGLISLLVVLLVVLLSSRAQLKALPAAVKPAASTAPAASAASAETLGGVSAPAAVRQQVEGLLEQGAQRASEAMP